MAQQPTFYKMKVTGPRCAEMITQPLQAMRELNPNLNAVIQSTEQMNKVLCEAAKQPLKKRRKIASSAVAIHDAHLQRVKALKSDASYAYDPMVQALMQQHQQQQPAREEAPAAPPAPVVEEEEEVDESSLGSRVGMETIRKAIPKKFHTKLETLGSYLKANPDVIRATPTGRPIVAGAEIPGAHISDIIRSLYVWSKSSTHPRGTREVLEALSAIGVPTHVFSNPSARKTYEALYESAEHPAVEVETQTEKQEGEEEHEMTTTKFETPLHEAAPPTIRKVEVTAPSKPEHAPPKQSPSITKSKLPKPSALPTKKASSKPSSSGQEGKGRKVDAERVRLPGKPIRILRIY